MTADVRSLQVSASDTFDLDSQAGILSLLRVIRLCDIAPADKNKVKDLVFLYNTGTKDASLKQKLEGTLTQLGITPTMKLPQVVKGEVAKVEEDTKVIGTKPGFSGGRLVPQFAPVKNVPTSMDKIVSAPAATVSVPVPEKKADVPTPKTESTQPNTNVIPVRKIAPSIPAFSKPSTIPTEVPKIVSVPTPHIPRVSDTAPVNVVIPDKKSEPATFAPPTQPVNSVVSETNPIATERMERIRAIKSAVNDRIGNPVNLVDVDNTLGREYMSALLEAMKLLSAASEAESAQAMNRLETVYTNVVTLLDSLDAKNAPPVVVSAPVTQATTPAPSVVASAPTLVSVPEVELPVAPVDFAIRSKVTEKPLTINPVSGWEASMAADPVAPVSDMQSVADVVSQADTTTVARLSTPPAPPIREAVTQVTPMYQPETVQSVTEKEPPLRSLSELKTADEVSSIEAMNNNPLYTKDVDAGLEQLLEEWAIFKKSGIFGSGPKGRQHPLYTKISGLQLPLILAGRFEGSTQEIKQSITDYMNGWRYEQGIVYEQNETLDQYLRRVIRHIIDLQKTKRRS